MFSGDSKRSSRFGLIGVFVVAALAAVIGLTAGEGESNPKLALGLIFGVIGIFVVVLLLLQRGDLAHVTGDDARDRGRAAAEGGRAIENPGAVSGAELWAALAVAPIKADAVAAQAETWDAGRRSIKLGALIVALIFLTVPPAYLLESFVPLLIGVPLIVIAALYGSLRAIGPGGELDRDYTRLDRAMKPLGLQLTARPKGGFEPRGPTMPGFDYRLRGLTEMSGERHRRAVTIRFGGHEDAGHSEVAIATPCHEFAAESKRVAVRSGPDGLLVSRRQAAQGDWLCDLWLAERLLAA